MPRHPNNLQEERSIRAMCLEPRCIIAEGNASDCAIFYLEMKQSHQMSSQPSPRRRTQPKKLAGDNHGEGSRYLHTYRDSSLIVLVLFLVVSVTIRLPPFIPYQIYRP